MLALSTPDKVHTCKSVGVWKVVCNVLVGKVMCQCEWVWKVMCRCVGVKTARVSAKYRRVSK